MAQTICPQCGRQTLRPKAGLEAKPGEVYCPTCKWSGTIPLGTKVNDVSK